MKKEDLKPGMYIDEGLVLEINLGGTPPDVYWGNDPRMLFVDQYDFLYGPCWRQLHKDEEFKERPPKVRQNIKRPLSK